jgi:hypothetical protein
LGPAGGSDELQRSCPKHLVELDRARTRNEGEEWRETELMRGRRFLLFQRFFYRTDWVERSFNDPPDVTPHISEE